MSVEITSLDYDSRVLSKEIEHFIDEYYDPKTESQRERVRIVLEALAPKPGERILDVGCGVGTFAFHASRLSGFAFGVDYSRESIKMAKRLTGLFNAAQMTAFAVANAMALPLKDNSFDKFVAADFVEHITPREKEFLLKELYRVLKPGGSGVVFTPNGIREKIGEAYRKCRHILFKEKVPTTDLHFGLTDRCQFERLLRRSGFNYTLRYEDVTRPYLAKSPFIRRALALNLLWIVKKI
jgi:ubiquinone/menaquinone biosynthesis C-methylase UbiE